MTLPRRAWMWMFAAAVGGLCGPVSAGDPAATSAYKVIRLDGVETGWIVGRCRITPVVPRWNVPARPCAKGGPSEMPTEAMIASADGGLANCVVSLKAIAAGKDWLDAMRGESREAGFEVGEGRYEPHLRVIRGGTQLSFANHGACDMVCHCWFETFAENKFNFAIAPGASIPDCEAAFIEKAGIYPMKDDCHFQMSGFVHVMPNPYFSVTSAADADERPAGSYSISRVPPGEYEVVLWHESMEESWEKIDGQVKAIRHGLPVVLTKKATVKANETVALDFSIRAPEGRAK